MNHTALDESLPWLKDFLDELIDHSVVASLVWPREIIASQSQLYYDAMKDALEAQYDRSAHVKNANFQTGKLVGVLDMLHDYVGKHKCIIYTVHTECSLSLPVMLIEVIPYSHKFLRDSTFTN